MFSLLLARRYDNNINKKRILVITISVAIALIIVDTSIVRVSGLVGWRFVHDWKNIILFIAMSCAYAVSYFFVLEFIKGRGEKELGYARGKMRLSAAYISQDYINNSIYHNCNYYFCYLADGLVLTILYGCHNCSNDYQLYNSDCYDGITCIPLLYLVQSK